MTSSAPRLEMLSIQRSSLVGESPECSICSEKYDDSTNDLVARMLACGHSMCSKCIFRYMQLSGRHVQGGMHVPCPNKCTNHTFVPEGCVENLPKNYALMDLVQGGSIANRSRLLSISSSTSPRLSGSIDSYYCDVCETNVAAIVCPHCSVVLCHSCSSDIHKRKGYHLHQLIPIDEYYQTDAAQQADSLRPSLSESSFDGSQEERVCKAHRTEALEFFCEGCYEEVCRLCVKGDHATHKCRALLEVSSEKKEALKQVLEEVNRCYETWNEGFDSCQAARENLAYKRETMEELIKSRFQAIHAKLTEREQTLLSQVKQETDRRSQLLNIQASQLARMCGIAKETIQECKTHVNQSEPHEMVAGGDKLLAQAQQCIRNEQDTTPMVSVCMQTAFDSEREVIEKVERLGELQSAPDRVEDVKVATLDPSKHLVRVSWQPPSGSDEKELLYTVEECTGESGSFSVVCEGRERECVVECVSDTYQFRVAASNSVGKGPYSMVIRFTPQKASFLWDPNLKHPRAQITNNGYTVSIGENALWVSVGTNIVLSHGTHYWEVILDRYGNPSMSRKVVIGVVSSPCSNWQRPHGVLGIMTSPIGSRSWGLACGTARKLNRGSTFLQSLGGKHRVFHEGDAVGVLLDLTNHKMEFYRNGKPLGIEFDDVTGPVIPAISFCRQKSLTLRFPPLPDSDSDDHSELSLAVSSSV